jgi:hypothetical protein
MLPAVELRNYTFSLVGRDSSVGIEIMYGADCAGI